MQIQLLEEPFAQTLSGKNININIDIDINKYIYIYIFMFGDTNDRYTLHLNYSTHPGQRRGMDQSRTNVTMGLSRKP